MKAERQALLEFIDLTERRLTAVADVRPPAWWPWLRVFVAEIQRHPLTKRLVEGVPPLEEDTLLWDERSGVPDDLRQWGRRAWALVVTIDKHRPVPGQMGTDAKILGREVRLHELYKLMSPVSSGECRKLAPQAAALYIQPILDWLRAEVASGAVLEHEIERWVQRTELFGVASAVGVVNETSLQDDLHRFLFDSGLGVLEINREQPLSGGAVDFLLRKDEAVPVELKVWRGPGPRLLSAWAFQTGRYVDGVPGRRAYLVIANLSEDKRLSPGADLQTCTYVRYGSIELYVRFVDLGRRAPSKDHAGRKEVRMSFADLGLLPLEPPT